MKWMAWTLPTVIFFVAVFLMLTFMVIWDLRSSPVARKGFLPISTDRGDRLYIGLIGSAFINLAWLGFTDTNQLWGVLIALIWMILVLRWG